MNYADLPTKNPEAPFFLASGARGTFSNRYEAVNPIEFPPNSGERKILAAVLAKCRPRSGPKGPSPDLISAVLEMKRRNPHGVSPHCTTNCPRIRHDK